MSIILPGSYPNPKPRQIIRIQESIAVTVLRKIQELVEESIKDCNGGLMPSQKELKKLLRREIHPDGNVFHFKGQPMLFIAPHKFAKVGAEWQLQVPHKKLYLKEPEPPMVATN